MDYGLFLRVVLVLAGVLILLIDIILLAKRRLLEPISMVKKELWLQKIL